jgi:hypothetical protein
MEIKNAVTILHVGKLVTADRERLCVVHSLASKEALIRTTLPLDSGQSVTLALRNGFTIAAVVGFVQGDQVLLMFEGQMSTSAMLAEQRDGRGGREAIRLHFTMPVSVTTPDGDCSCVMQDISLSGVKVIDENASLAVGTDVQISIEGLGKRDASVCWRQDRSFGLQFHVPLGFKLLDQWTAQMQG